MKTYLSEAISSLMGLELTKDARALALGVILGALIHHFGGL